MKHPSEIATGILASSLHYIHCNRNGEPGKPCTCGADNSRTVARAYLDLLASINEADRKPLTLAEQLARQNTGGSDVETGYGLRKELSPSEKEGGQA